MIAGFVKTSLVDFPGNVCSTLFIQGCNFACPFCHNPELIKDKGIESIDFDNEIIPHLEKARKILDGVCFSGGEATLDKRLPYYIEKVKELGLRVKLDTNGWKPEFLELPVDYVAMDIKTVPSRYKEFTNIPQIEDKIKESIKFLMNQDAYKYEFRTTLVPGFVGEKEIKEIGELIKGSPKWFLQKYKNDITLDPKYKDLDPYGEETNSNLLKLAQEYVPNTKLR